MEIDFVFLIQRNAIYFKSSIYLFEYLLTLFKNILLNYKNPQVQEFELNLKKVAFFNQHNKEKTKENE